MFSEARDLIASKGASKPLHVVFHEHLHCGAVYRTRALNRHVDTTGNRHVRAKKKRLSRRIGEGASRRRPRFTVSKFRRFFFLHY